MNVINACPVCLGSSYGPLRKGPCAPCLRDRMVLRESMHLLERFMTWVWMEAEAEQRSWASNNQYHRQRARQAALVKRLDAGDFRLEWGYGNG